MYFCSVALQFPFSEMKRAKPCSNMKTWCVNIGEEELVCPAQSHDLNPTFGMTWKWSLLNIPTSAPELMNTSVAE